MMRMFSGTLDISKEKPGFLVSVWQLNMVRSGESHVDRKGGDGVAAAATRLFTYKLAEPSKKTSRKINQSNDIVQKKNQAAGCGGANRLWVKMAEWRSAGERLEPPLLDGVSGDITDRWRLWAAAPVNGATEQQMSDVAVSNGKQA